MSAVSNRSPRAYRPVGVIAALVVFAPSAFSAGGHESVSVDVAHLDRGRILTVAAELLTECPVTITAFVAPRSAGGVHEFYSEGDYWWPDSTHPDGPYIRRDGMSNPDNFTMHREAMMHFSRAVATLTAAYRITGDRRYADAAIRHLRAWFVDTTSMMAPNLRYAQAIKGRVTGRGIGIIDTIHLIEVARSVEVLSDAGMCERNEEKAIRRWFAEYLHWMTTDPYGIDERDTKNNHATWWLAQVAAFAHLTNDSSLLTFCRDRFMRVLLPTQLGPDGSFPLELERTKPYSYSIFNLDGMAMLCQILSTTDVDLWEFALPDGRGVRKAVAFLFPFLANKGSWPYAHDVMYFDSYPFRQPFLLFAGLAYNEERYVDLWKSLDPDPVQMELQRGMPVRQPVLWVQ
jgi:Alginate lyase